MCVCVCFSPAGCALQSSRFTYGHRRVSVVGAGAGPGEEEPEVTVKVLPLRAWRSILLVNSVENTHLQTHAEQL